MMPVSGFEACVTSGDGVGLTGSEYKGGRDAEQTLATHILVFHQAFRALAFSLSRFLAFTHVLIALQARACRKEDSRSKLGSRSRNRDFFRRPGCPDRFGETVSTAAIVG